MKALGMLGRRGFLAMTVVCVALAGILSARPSAEPVPAFADALWVATTGNLLKLRLDDGSLLLRQQDLAGALEVAVDAGEARVWVFDAQGTLSALDFEGELLAGVPFPGHLDDPSRVRLAAGGGFAWLGFERVVYQVDGAGELVASLPLSSDLRDLAFDPGAFDPGEGRLWIADRRELAGYDLEGHPVASVDLGPRGQIVTLAAEPGGGLWVAEKDSLRRYGEELDLLAQVPVHQPQDVAADGQGGAWVARKQELVRVAGDGTVLFATPLPQGGGSANLFAVAAEPGGAFAWGISKHFLFQVDGQGELVRRVPLRQFGPGTQAQGATLYVDSVAPEIAFEAPPEGALLADARPVLELAWSDGGIGVDPSSLEVEANGAHLPVSCTSTAAGGSCTPDLPLPEGAVSLAASVADFRGNRSPASTRMIAIDAVPPAAPVVDRIQVAALSEGQVQVVGSAGSVEGGAAVTVTSLATGESVTVPAGADGSFEAVLAAAAGEVLTVVATDAAGNRSSPVQLTVPGPPEPELPPDPVTVAPPLDRTVATDLFAATEFLYTGEDPIQVGVAPGTIERRRVAVLRGRVLDRAGDPLPGVEVTVHRHPKYGRTLSRADGAFDLVVNGGGPLTLAYDKAGYLPAQRPVAARWRHYAHAADVVLIPADEAATLVLADQSSVQMARGSEVTDEDSSRRATLLFQPGTGAELVFPDGSRQALASLTVRATEYSVGTMGPLAMPAPLPPNTGYTYAVELSADEALTAGAARVELSQPAVHYVENFLGFPVGGIVPAGYYDRSLAAWVPSANGRIVEVLSTDAGTAVLDVTGDGLPAGEEELEELGVTARELEALALLYPPGQSLWRVPIPHFTPWDCNWPYGPPEDAEPPPPPDEDDDDADESDDEGDDGDGNDDGDGDDTDEPHDPDEDSDEEDEPDCEEGSVIECQSQVLREVVALDGTSLSLHYGSDRMPGRGASRYLELRLTRPAVPSSLRRIRLEVGVAGRLFTSSHEPAPDLFARFDWDGFDAYGRPVQGSVPVRVRTTYFYDGVYYGPADFRQSFSRFPTDGGVALRATRESGQIEVSRTTPELALDPTLGQLDFRALGLGGWTLSAHHFYDPTRRTLYPGYGGRRSASPIGRFLHRMAGTGAYGFSGDGGPARDGELAAPWGLAAGPDGSLYLADRDNHRIRRVAPDGTLSTVAGSGESCQDGGGPVAVMGRSAGIGPCGEGGPALEALLTTPSGVAVGPDGLIYLTDTGNACVRRVERDSSITTVAGICEPPGVHGASPAPSGETSRPAGGGPGSLAPRGFGDGGCDGFGACPATDFALGEPTALAFAPDGGFYVADEGEGTVYFVGTGGVITPVAGGGSPADGIGDGLPATEASLLFPAGLALDPDGALLIADFGHHRVRRVGPDGVIRTVAGSGQAGFGGDGLPATEGRLDGPAGLAAGPDGTLYVADAGNRRIRRVSPRGILSTYAGSGAVSAGDLQPDGTPAPGIDFGRPLGLAVGPDGVVYFSDFFDGVVEGVAPDLPGYADGEILIPAAGGGEVYVFDSDGRHLRTVNALTGAELLRFDYDDAGRLAAVEDPFGNRTVIEREIGQEPAGAPTAIVAPFGQRTELTLDAGGYLASIADPAGERVFSFHYDLGLMTGMTDPRGNAYAYQYDPRGRLLRDEDPAGGFKELRRRELVLAPGSSGYGVALETAGGSVRDYRVISRRDRRERLRIHRMNDTEVVRTRETARGDGTTVSELADGTVVTSRRGPDPAWGSRDLARERREIRTPSGLTRTAGVQRDATLSDPDDPLSVESRSARVTVNGRAFQRLYDGTTGQTTWTSPEGRSVVSVTDSLGRVVESRIGGLAPLAVSYDAAGRLSALTQGGGAEARTVTFGYNAGGRLESVTDPLSRTVSFAYDALGRILRQTLPDGRVIDFASDANGNLTTLEPPGRPGHGFSYTPVDLQEEYAPPPVGAGTDRTRFVYDLDRRLTRVERPDGSAVDLAYDAGGRLTSISAPEGVTTIDYRPGTRDPVTLTAPDGGTLTYGYDGFLLTSTTWSGQVAGSVERTYDADFRVVRRTVNGGHAVTFAYDRDGLLTAAGSLAIDRQPASGLVTGTTLGQVTTATSRNAFGEPLAEVASFAGSPLLEVAYTRDALGRITGKTETLGGVTHTYGYTYDLAGRLTRVEKNGALFAEHTYDANGNRLTYQGTFGAATGTYDDQDRLLTYGDATYTYTAAGELAGKSANGQTVTYDYGALGDLLGVTLASGIEIDYVVDGRNRRIGKKVDGTLVQGFLYKDRLNPVAELDGAGNVVARFVYGTRAHVPDSMVKAGTTYRLISDHLGSVRLVVDAATGTVAQRLDYDEHGRVILDTHPGFQPFGFAGGLYDPQTGLVRFGARDYDPEVGRWTAKDPVGFAGGDSSLYEYAHGDPVNYIDPIGLVRFRGGTAPQREAAYQFQDMLRENLKPETVAFFQDNYGVDLPDTLSPCSGPEVWLEDLPPGARGEYDDGIWVDDILIDPETLANADLFQATLLHELVHWAADQASWLGSHSPRLQPALLAAVEARGYELAEQGGGSISFALHSKPPYAAEYIQFGDLLTLIP